MTVSVAMIVKDEEQTLPRCLESIAGHVDEIVIVDTGSSDATVDIARRFADRLLSFEWCDDFAAARQFAFDNASGDWLCWLDADDVVVGAEQIRPLAEAARPEVGGFYWRYVCGRDRWGNPECEFWRERCVRRDGAFVWRGRIHETLSSDRRWQMERADGVVVEHHSPPERAGRRSLRNLRLLEREYEDSAGRPSARLLFYLAREHFGAGNLERALDLFERCAVESGWDDERYFTQLHIADVQRRLGNSDGAIEAGLRALAICPHWPNAYFSLAETYYYRQDWHKLIHWCDIGRAMPEPDTLQIMNPATYRYAWLIYYTNALFHVGAVHEASAWTARALTLCPDEEQHLANLRFFATVEASAGKEGAHG